MGARFISDYENRVLYQSFDEPYVIAQKADLILWKQAWMRELATWHFPYRTLIDCSSIRIVDPKVAGEIDALITHFKSLYLNSVVGYGRSEEAGHDALPFEVFTDEQAAVTALRLKKRDGIRSRVGGGQPFQLTTHIGDAFIELTFFHEVDAASSELWVSLKNALLGQLMQIHTPWILLIEVSQFKNLTQHDWEAFNKLTGLLTTLHLLKTVGYLASSRALPAEEAFPFEVHPSRQHALASIRPFKPAKIGCRS
jgi:hypothetical protein